MLKRYLFGFMSLLFISSSSCTFDTTVLSCSKMTNTSSVSIDELLKAPESIIIDNKNYEIVGDITVYGSEGGSVDIFPTFKTKNRCSSVGFRTQHIQAINTTGINISSNYKYKTLWVLINNQVWETNYIKPTELGSSFTHMTDNGPSFELGKEAKIIVKISDDKGKDFFLKSKDSLTVSGCCI